MFKLMLILLGSFFCISVQAASFDCKLALSNIEKMICADAELSLADEKLAKIYVDIKGKARKPDLLTQSQLDWLKQRNRCSDASCLSNEYKSRSEAVLSWVEYENKTPSKPGGEVQCNDRPECWPEGSAMNTGLTLAATQQKKSSQLSVKHLELINLLSASPNYKGANEPDTRVISAIKAQQLSWEKYKDDECELIGSLSGAGGSWPSTYATQCRSNLTEERLSRITSAIKCIHKISVDKRWMDQANCLQQLAPLANKL